MNDDGKVDTSDASTLINKILGLSEAENADIDGDGDVDVTDVTSLISIILNK